MNNFHYKGGGHGQQYLSDGTFFLMLVQFPKSYLQYLLMNLVGYCLYHTKKHYFEKRR